MVICKHFICRQLKICLQKSETKRIRTACKIFFTLSLHRLFTFRFNFVKNLLRLRIVLRRHVVSKPRNARDSTFKYSCSFTKKNNIMITMFIDRPQPTGPHGHVSGPLVKIDMGHCIRRGL